MDVERALANQLKNIETRTGKSLEQLVAIVRASGLARHSEMRDMLKRDLGMGHGDANTLVHHVLWEGQEKPATQGDSALDEIYSGPKSALRPLHDAVMERIGRFGPFEIAAKKGYLSLRRRKQLATLGPATRTQVEIGLNAKGLAGSDRLVALPPGQMCAYKVRISELSEVDEELEGWLRQAYDSAG